uniref:Putative neurotoxin 3 n=1 Tax=Scolopendra mutilans TaxID=2836329 RepID=PNX34_SCOMU|nr:RecName: Full=Putative neurotoxin 3; AltName: Full=Putative neurotoxin 4; Flags: Precursor [Scolopendra mutilans]AFM55023.1 putative neurotoxin 4 [Scolopendra subspinipes]
MKAFIAILSIAIVLLLIVSIKETSAKDCKQECVKRYTNGDLTNFLKAEYGPERRGGKCYCEFTCHVKFYIYLKHELN